MTFQVTCHIQYQCASPLAYSTSSSTNPPQLLHHFATKRLAYQDLCYATNAGRTHVLAEKQKSCEQLFSFVQILNTGGLQAVPDSSGKRQEKFALERHCSRVSTESENIIYQVSLESVAAHDRTQHAFPTSLPRHQLCCHRRLSVVTPTAAYRPGYAGEDQKAF
ncbi:hypothetical protein BDZ85DRAFT_267699 [Elsinoe ampelina]|uniref:Uncharacterized protein n=1 Tax=Elsinoe ampelina TaxID=302913 RepID=A0A6A6G2A6_9PEZI|nr:hypothetical protein BDZ85DRAFT_267699 [Elsinoe ampelina]